MTVPAFDDTEPGRARPVALLAMSPDLVEALFDRAALRQLSALVRVDPERVLHGPVPEPADPSIGESLVEAEVLITCWGAPRLDRAALAALPRLHAVVHAAGSVKRVVTDACREAGIQVSSAAAVNALPVAEYTLAMILLANKRTLWLARRYGELRSGWRGSEIPPDIGNYGRTVGIVGASWIGRRVMELLRPFDLRVLLADPYIERAEAQRLGVELVSLDELCARSDVVSVHAPEVPATRHMIDGRRLATMRDGATLINTARGVLVDTAALSRELRTGRLYAVLDHTDPKILPDDSPLFELANVLVTPHIAGSHGNELRRMGLSAISEVARYVAGEEFASAVSYASLERSA